MLIDTFDAATTPVSARHMMSEAASVVVTARAEQMPKI